MIKHNLDVQKKHAFLVSQGRCRFLNPRPRSGCCLRARCSTATATGSFCPHGERVRFAMRKRRFESREIVLRRSPRIIRPSKQEGFDGVFFAGFFLDLQTSSFDLMILRAMILSRSLLADVPSNVHRSFSGDVFQMPSCPTKGCVWSQNVTELCEKNPMFWRTFAWNNNFQLQTPTVFV